jgi:hypothetical protein
MLKQTASRRYANGCVGIVQAFFEERKNRHRHFSQGFDSEESRLGLLILQERLEDRKRLLIGCCAERLRHGGANRGIRMPSQVGGDQYCRGIAQSQEPFDGACPHLHRSVVR